MPILKPGTIIPTEEEKAINEGILADSDTYELSDIEFSKLRPDDRSIHPMTKNKITLSLSPIVSEYFMTTGKDWQEKVNKILLEYIATHQHNGLG